jgi:hypothetical protein
MMEINGHSRQFAVHLAVAAIAVCGTSGMSSAGTPVAADDSPGGAEAGTTVIFQQPVLGDIQDGWYIAHVTKGGVPQGAFGLVSWNPNPHETSGEYVASTWNAAADTGFTPKHVAVAQLSMQNKIGSTTGQIEGETVGAYLNAKDLDPPKAGEQMMISPQYIFPAGEQPTVYTSTASTLSSSMKLQVPVAEGSDTFVSADLLFTDPNGVRMSYSIKLFDNGHATQELGSGYDALTDSFMFNCPLAGEPLYITQGASSADGQGAPYVGWLTFEWSISEAQFAAAINYMQQQFPGKIATSDPSQWLFTEVHLNAQLLVQTLPAELGWSMRGWQVSVTQ